MVLAKGYECLLGEVWVDLDLKNGRLDASITENVGDQRALAVAEGVVEYITKGKSSDIRT